MWWFGMGEGLEVRVVCEAAGLETRLEMNGELV